MSAALALPPPLVALSPGDLRPGATLSFLARVEAAVGAGLRGLLLREGSLLDGEFLQLARTLRKVLPGAAGGWLALHDRPHLAAAAGADAVHLGFRSLAPDVARRASPAGCALGLSTHAGDDTAVWRDADYLFHGPVLPTPSKSGLVAPVGVAGLRRAVESSDRPIWGLGGMKPADVGLVLAAGARGVAVLSGLLGSEDPAAATRAYLVGVVSPGEGPPVP